MMVKVSSLEISVNALSWSHWIYRPTTWMAKSLYHSKLHILPTSTSQITTYQALFPKRLTISVMDPSLGIRTFVGKCSPISAVPKVVNIETHPLSINVSFQAIDGIFVF